MTPPMPACYAAILHGAGAGRTRELVPGKAICVAIASDLVSLRGRTCNIRLTSLMVPSSDVSDLSGAVTMALCWLQQAKTGLGNMLCVRISACIG